MTFKQSMNATRTKDLLPVGTYALQLNTVKHDMTNSGYRYLQLTGQYKEPKKEAVLSEDSFQFMLFYNLGEMEDYKALPLSLLYKHTMPATGKDADVCKTFLELVVDDHKEAAEIFTEFANQASENGEPLQLLIDVEHYTDSRDNKRAKVLVDKCFNPLDQKTYIKKANKLKAELENGTSDQTTNEAPASEEDVPF